MEISRYILGASFVTFILRIVHLMLRLVICRFQGHRLAKACTVAVMEASLVQELLLSEQVFLIKGNALKLASAFTSFPGCHVYEKSMEYGNDWHAFNDDTIILLITTKHLNDWPI
ncbi:hypothetical protein [Peribacillus sp. Bi134]|uniref:hypothetical protein n=1 Tax=Peribacillus sp. Bi134 TaxID=2884272 RepID=UPI001E415F40|nr:hypothetical protein [Peribacillus sp. Bi134]